MRRRKKAYDTGNLRGAPLKGGKVQDGEVKRQNSETQHFPSSRERESGRHFAILTKGNQLFKL